MQGMPKMSTQQTQLKLHPNFAKSTSFWCIGTLLLFINYVLTIPCKNMVVLLDNDPELIKKAMILNWTWWWWRPRPWRRSGTVGWKKGLRRSPSIAENRPTRMKLPRRALQLHWRWKFARIIKVNRIKHILSKAAKSLIVVLSRQNKVASKTRARATRKHWNLCNVNL